MRPPLALCLLLATVGCDASTDCPGFRLPSGIARSAHLVRVELYDSGVASCTDGQLSLHGADAPQVFTFTDAGGRLVIELPPGDKVIRLRAYADETHLLGDGCAATSVSPGGATCVDLVVQPADAGSGAADAAMAGGNPDLSGADLSGCVSHHDGETAFSDCSGTDYSESSDGARNMCEHYYPDSGTDCFHMGCNGGNTGDAWCTKAVGNVCRCWGYGGDGSGYMVAVTMNGSCLCPTPRDHKWF